MKRFLSLILISILPSSLFAEQTQSAARAQAAVALAYSIVTHDRPQIVPPVHPTPDRAAPEKPSTYRAAYEAYTTHRRPMVVMVTAAWCPYCPQVKSQLEALQQTKRLGDAALVILDYDQDQLLARQVMGNHRGLPFVALFTHEAGQAQTYRQVSMTQLTKLLPTEASSRSK